MAQAASPNDGRTLVAAVMFADLVGYSKKSVTDQLAMKNAFREVVHATLSPLEPDARVLVDTGDGAAVAFLRDPEHALYAALQLADAVKAGGSAGGLSLGDLRIGINLGPVRRAIDVNGRPNLVGDGINAAERVMSFAAPGEAMSSRSFRDAVACLHESYAQLFGALGSRADKHGREHEVFRIGHSAPALAASTTSLVPAVATGEPRRVDRRSARRRMGAAALALAGVGALFLAWALRPQPVERTIDASPGVENPGPPAHAVSTTATIPARPSEPAIQDSAPAPSQPSTRPAGGAPAPRDLARNATPASRRHESPVPAAPARCAALTQKATLGELSETEQQLLRQSCR